MSEEPRRKRKEYNGSLGADTLAEVHALIGQIEDCGSEVHLEGTDGEMM